MKTMFKRLLCGLLGGGLIATTASTGMAVALSEDELLDKLAVVPVFVLLDDSGTWFREIVDLPNDGLGYVALLRVFFDEADVIDFVEERRADMPTFNQDGSVGLIDLATIRRRSSENRDIPLVPVYIPQDDDLQAARALESDFRGVPLFALQDAPGRYLPLSVNSGGAEPVFSMFFSKQDADSVLSEIRQENPNNPALSEVSIGVVSFNQFLDDLLSRDDEQFEFVRFSPDSEIVNHIQDLQIEAQSR